MSNVFIEKKRVLIVSDDPRSLAEIKLELKDMFDASIAATSAAVYAAMESYKIALVVIHIGESHEKALSIFSDISKLLETRNVPAIFLAEKGSDDDETNAFEIGAVDYTVRRRGTLNALCSRINLRIRASEAGSRASFDEAGKSAPQASPEDALAGKTILVVDDVELNREVIASMLMDINGLILEFAEDGMEAVEKYTESPNRYSLILMDVQMPVMDGMQATKAIRGLGFENSRKIPIVALTADIDGSEIGKYLEAGMNSHIQKPMAYDELINLVAEYCF